MQQNDAGLVRKGYIHVFRLYEVAYSIELQEAQEIVQKQVDSKVSRISLVRAEPKSIYFDVPPLEIALGQVHLPLEGRNLPFEVIVRAYDFGIITLMYRLKVENLGWEEYAGLVNHIDNQFNQNPEWQRVLDEWLLRAKTLLSTSLKRPSQSKLQEDYIVAEVVDFDKRYTNKELFSSFDFVPLLSGETRPLAEETRRDLVKRSFSYYEDDLVILTWDRAFVYDAQQDSGVMDVIQLGNAQLLELRYYDEVLDEQLPVMYDKVEEAQQALGGLFRSKYAQLARSLYTQVAEVTEITERVDNALKVTEDVYYARVYSGVLDIFKVKNFAAAVDRKLSIMKDTYTALYDEAASIRSELLEAAIVILIVMEIIMAFIGIL